MEWSGVEWVCGLIVHVFISGGGFLECVSDNVVPARQLVEDKGPTF